MIVLCKATDVAPGSAKLVELEGMPPLAVFNLAGTFYVLDDTCTHGQASLADGYVEGDQIECPWHGGRFCIRTGEAKCLPALSPVRSHAVTMVGDDVCIERDAP